MATRKKQVETPAEPTEQAATYTTTLPDTPTVTVPEAKVEVATVPVKPEGTAMDRLRTIIDGRTRGAPPTLVDMPGQTPARVWLLMDVDGPTIERALTVIRQEITTDPDAAMSIIGGLLGDRGVSYKIVSRLSL